MATSQPHKASRPGTPAPDADAIKYPINSLLAVLDTPQQMKCGKDLAVVALQGCGAPYINYFGNLTRERIAPSTTGSRDPGSASLFE